MNKAEAMIIYVVPDSVIRGLDCGYDSNVSGSASDSNASGSTSRVPNFDALDLTTPLSQILKQSTNVLFTDDQENNSSTDGSETSFDISRKQLYLHFRDNVL